MLSPRHQSRVHSILPLLPMVLLLAVAWSLPGCMSYQAAQMERPQTRHLEVRHEVHGTMYATRVDEGVWYVLQGNRLVVLDLKTGRQVKKIVLAPAGQAGPAVDLLVEPTVIRVVLKDTAVVELDRTDPRRPWVESRWDAAELGIAPRAIDPGRTGAIVSGVGGAVQLPSLHRIVDHDAEVTSVVELEDDAFYTTGRRVYRVRDGGYVGSATDLERFPPAVPGGPPSAEGVVFPRGSMLFIRNEVTGGLGGFAFMDRGLLREVDSSRSTEALSGGVTRVRVKGNRVLIAGLRGVHLYRLDSNGTLHETWSHELQGTRDVDFVDDRDIVAVGDFGWARLRTDRQRDAVMLRHDAPGGLLQAVSDGRRIMATGIDGIWEYRIGDTAELVKDTPRLYPPPSREAAMLGWEVSLSSDGHRATVRNDFGEETLLSPERSSFTTVISGDGAFWIGHEQGMLMIKPPRELPALPRDWETMTEEERLASGYSPLEGVQKLAVEIDGPIVFIQPLDLGGGVAYAAQHGGFGVVRETW